MADEFHAKMHEDAPVKDEHADKPKSDVPSHEGEESPQMVQGVVQSNYSTYKVVREEGRMEEPGRQVEEHLAAPEDVDEGE